MLLALAFTALPAVQPASAQQGSGDLSIVCVSKHTKLLRAIKAGQSCQPFETTIQLPDGGPVDACANNFTGILRLVGAGGACTTNEHAFVLAGADLSDVCVNVHTGLIRDPAPSGACRSYEYGAQVLPELVSSVYVVDSLNNRIQQFTLDGEFIREWGSQGEGPGEFSDIFRIAVDAQGNVYATDGLNCRVQKFTYYGEFVLEWGDCGEGDGQFSLPAGIDVDSQGNVYVSDVFGGRVQKFDSSGTYLDEFGTSGTGQGQFLLALDVAIDSQDNVYVTDPFFNERVQVFASDGTYQASWAIEAATAIDINAADDVFITQDGDPFQQVSRYTTAGQLVLDWGEPGTGNGGFNGPQDVAVSESGVVYVSDRNNQLVQRFDLDGNFIDQWGGAGNGPGQFGDPIGIAVFDATAGSSSGR